MKTEYLNLDKSSKLLIAFIIITFITSISVGLLQSFVDKWFSNRFVTITVFCLHAIRTVCYILPALAIKNKTFKIISIILVSIMIIYILISPVFAIIHSNVF